MIRAALALLLLGGTASADTHGSVGLGGSLQLGHRRRRWRPRLRGRADGELDIIPFGRYGGLLALRGADQITTAFLCAGLLVRGRSRRARRPRWTCTPTSAPISTSTRRSSAVACARRSAITGPLAVALDSGAYLVLQGLYHTRLVPMGAACAALENALLPPLRPS